MIKKQIFKLIKKQELTDITINLNNSKENELVFYKCGEVLDKDLFNNRLSLSKANYIITNNINLTSIDPLKIFFIEDFLKFKHLCIDQLYKTTLEVTNIGITGTNGKTSTTWFIKEFLKKDNNVILFGTNGIYLNDDFLSKSINTTPDYSIYLKTLHKVFKEKKIKKIITIMEVSSHALSQQRTLGIEFDYAAITSISQDHLDYHKNMNNYIAAKKLLLDMSEKFYCFKNMKFIDEYSKGYIDKITLVTLDNKLYSDFEIPTFQKRNHFLAFLISKEINRSIVFDKNLIFPDGRFEILSFKKSKIIIDYAHTPDAFIEVYNNTKKLFSNPYIVTVFGCGGDRDIGKRKIMGSIADKFSNEVILTNDNPRCENDDKIINDIISGFENKKFKIIKNRKEAIVSSLNNCCNKNIVILILGKGHEDYQEVNNIRSYFKDRDVVKEFINAKS